MPLSESERRTLDALEASFREHDPEFVKTMSTDETMVSYRNVVLGILTLALGIIIMLIGVSFQSLIMGIFGFLVMGFGGLVMFKKVSKMHVAKDYDGNKKPQSAFMKKLEDEWDERKRREGNNG